MKNLPVLCILSTIDLFAEIDLIHRSWFQFSFPGLVPSLKHKAAKCLQEANGPFPAGHGLQQA